MKLQTKQLKQFKAVSSGIKSNGIIPILSYLKFEPGNITKSNLEAFVIMDADVTDAMLIDEKVLMNFVDFTNADTITVTVKGNSIIITDGKAKVTSPTEDIKNFPAIAEATNKPVNIEPEVIEAIKVASNFTIEDSTMPFKECVFLGNGIVAASSGFICYTKAMEAPTAIIHNNVAASLIKFHSLLYSETETYQFFTNGIFKFGFVKNDTKFINMTPFSVIPEGEPTEVEKQELIKFCDICISNTPGRVVTATINGNKMLMQDAAYGIDIEIPLSAKLDNFSFNPVIMAKMLKALPDEKLKFVRSTNKYFITGDSGFVSLIMEIKAV